MQGILYTHIKTLVATSAHGIPECFSVFGGRTASLVLSGLVRCTQNRSGCRLAHLKVIGRLAFQTLNFLAESDHVGFHLVVLCGSFSGNKPVRAALLVKELLCGVPDFVALLAQFKDFIHCHYLHKFSG